MNWTCPLGAALLLTLASPAFAVNYPTELRFTLSPSDIAAPGVLIGFNNNEGDRVRFEIEITVSGVSLGPSGVRDSIRCVWGSANGDDCKGIPGNLRAPFTTEKGWRAATFAPPALVQFDTDYCFRVQAVDDNNRRSAWAPWSCMHTPPLPRRPAVAPTRPQVTLIDEGSTGRGQVGPATPARVLVEWSRNASFQGWYAVERSRAGPTLVWSEIGRLESHDNQQGGDLELVEAIKDASAVPGQNNPTHYRVCAANIGGKTCSTSALYPPAYFKETAGVRSDVAGLVRPRPDVAAQRGTSAAAFAPLPVASTPAGNRLAQRGGRTDSTVPSAFATAAAAHPASAPQRLPVTASPVGPPAALAGRSPAGALDWNRTAPSAFGGPAPTLKP